MNGAQIHLLLNHLPVLIPMVGTVLILASFLAKSADLREAGAWIIAFAAIMAIPVYLSGESAENVVKNYPNVGRLLIGDHEDAATRALIFLDIAGTVSLVLVLACRLKKNLADKVWLWSVLIILSLVSFGFMAQAAHLGGLIRHEEIRNTDRY